VATRLARFRRRLKGAHRSVSRKAFRRDVTNFRAIVDRHRTEVSALTVQSSRRLLLSCQWFTAVRRETMM